MTFKLKVEKDKSKRNYSCMDCNAKATYFNEYDTFACLSCDQWLDICNCKPADKCPFPKPQGKPSAQKI